MINTINANIAVDLSGKGFVVHGVERLTQPNLE